MRSLPTLISEALAAGMASIPGSNLDAEILAAGVASSALIDVWDDLVAAIDAAPSGTWVPCTAWAVGGGDPENFDIRLVGGRSIYTNAWVVFGKEGRRDRVRLARIEPASASGPREIVRWLDSEDLVEVRRR